MSTDCPRAFDNNKLHPADDYIVVPFVLSHLALTID